MRQVLIYVHFTGEASEAQGGHPDTSGQGQGCELLAQILFYDTKHGGFWYQSRGGNGSVFPTPSQGREWEPPSCSPLWTGWQKLLVQEDRDKQAMRTSG